MILIASSIWVMGGSVIYRVTVRHAEKGRERRRRMKGVNKKMTGAVLRTVIVLPRYKVRRLVWNATKAVGQTYFGSHGKYIHCMYIMFKKTIPTTRQRFRPSACWEVEQTPENGLEM